MSKAAFTNLEPGSDEDRILFGELDQMVHTEGGKDQRTNEKVVVEDRAKIFQDQIRESRVLLDVDFDRLE